MQAIELEKMLRSVNTLETKVAFIADSSDNFVRKDEFVIFVERLEGLRSVLTEIEQRLEALEHASDRG